VPNNGLDRRAVQDFLNVVLAGITLPEPATVTDERAYLELLDNRVTWVRSILGRVIDRGIDASPLDLPHETARLREHLRRYPPTYKVAPARPVRDLSYGRRGTLRMPDRAL